MSQVTDAIRAHHAELAKTLTTYAQALEEGRTDIDPAAIVTFLKGDLYPHAQGEEASLYPLMNKLVCEHGRATATMTVDHEFIGDYIRQIEQAANALQATQNGKANDSRKQLGRLLVQLDALFQVHLEKEERVYLPLFEKYLTDEEQQRALDEMHDVPHAPAAAQTIDVRTIPPFQRHSLIFGTFEALNPGAAFLLVNDHDPKPLYYQFKFERDGEFSWEYQEEGPQVWKVLIGKV
ncbi:MAG: hypothetical protein HDKAJFGB_03325 [Anaerolineae bacterium]|nr:hypothetical protein [Anaerolineae bacterium]